jgi:anti-anti-sigma factor
MVRTMEEEGHLTIRSFVDPTGRTARLSLRGELDLNATTELSRMLDELAEGDAETVLLDASGLTFLDSSGLGMLLTWRDQFDANGRQFKVVDASAPVARVLEITGTREMLEGTG